MSITVNVWPNNKSPFGGIQAHPGHASMECKDPNFYISWRQAYDWVPFNIPGSTTATLSINEQKKFAYSPTSIHHDALKEMSINALTRFESVTAPLETQKKFAVTDPNPRNKGNFRNFQFGAEAGIDPACPASLWVQMPTNTVSIPDFDDYDHNWPAELPKGIGLNPFLINYWWNGFNQSDGTPRIDLCGWLEKTNAYKFNSRFLNCASVVGRALDYGGAAWFFEQSFSQDRYYFYNTPLNVAHYALELNKRIKEYREFILTLKNISINKIIEQWPTAENTLPAVEEWKEKSYVAAKWYKTARRIEQVLDIDKELAVYWATEDDMNIAEAAKIIEVDKINKENEIEAKRIKEAIKDNKVFQGPANRRLKELHPIIPKKINKKYPLTKLASCFKMLRLVKEHVTKKPTSDRRDAVIRLGRRIANVIGLLQTGLASNPKMKISLVPKNFDKFNFNNR